jgi:hypothetical protein
VRSQNTFYFFFSDSQGRSAYWEDGIVKWQATPKPLQFSPDGWKETQIGFSRSQKYFGINRQFTNAYRFVEDGANILRYLMYKGLGYETKIYLIVTKWDGENDIYEPYYRGEIDLVKMQDDPEKGVTANMIEGDLLKFINAGDDIEFEIPLANQIEVQMDAVVLANQANYSFINQEVSGSDHVSPIVFLSVDQTLPGFIYQSQFYAGVPDDYYFFYTEKAQTIQVSGFLKATRANAGFFTANYGIVTESGTSYTNICLNLPVLANTGFDVDLAKTIAMPANSTLIMIGSFAGVNNIGTYIESNFQINFNYTHPSSLVKAIRPFELFKALLLKMLPTQIHTPVSAILETTNPHLVLTSGDAIRGITAPVLKTSFSRFFDSLNKILFCGFGVSGLNAIFEERAYFFDVASNTLDLGEVADMSISIAEDQLINSVKAGYPVQDIEKLNGKYSFNNTNIFTLPINRVKKEYDLVSQYLTDPYVIENVRTNFDGKTTTDNKSDNTVFVLNTVPAKPGFTGVGLAYSGIQGYEFVFSDLTAEISSFNENDYFSIENNGDGLDGSYRVISSVVDGSFLRVVVSPGTSDLVVFSSTADISFPIQLKRLVYNSITGVPADSNVYNIEQLTPKRMITAHGSYFRSVMHFLTIEKMGFTTADRNKDLVTTFDGVTVSESADIRVDTLPDPYFYPFIFSFKTRVPDTFQNIFTDAVNGHLLFEYNGVQLYGYPLQMSVKPALNEVQEWKVLASTRNNLNVLVDLLQNPLNGLNMSSYGLSFSKLCPVQFYPESYSQDGRYNFKHMDAYSFSGQSERYGGYQPYNQKWQTNDNIPLQCITNSLGPVQIDVVNKHGRVFGTYLMDVVTTTAVALPYILYETTIDLSGLEEGTYFLKCTAGIDAATVIFMSEPLCVKEIHPKSMLFEYSNTRNQAATIFSTGYSPCFRVESFLHDFAPGSRFSSYEDEPANMYLIEGQAFRKFSLFIGDGFGVPPYVADKINRIFNLNTVLIDGKAFVRDEDSQIEAVGRVPGMPGTWWRLPVREAFNYDAMSQDTDGELNGAAVLINVDTALFGDLSGQVVSNPVQITVLNP